MANLPKRQEITVKEFEQALDAKVLAVIDYDCETFSQAANNGQMIEELNAKAKAVEKFHDIALKMTRRKEIKPEKIGKFAARGARAVPREAEAQALRTSHHVRQALERTFAAKTCRAAIACASGDDDACGAAGRATAATAAGCRRSRRAPKPVVETQRKHSEEYYDVKTTVFNALIDTIDLTQLAKLDSVAAREEIRDIVSEIIQIKNVVMSISEQEELLEDICNDVLGYGPLEPLLARDDIADIMVNGAERDVHRSRRQSAEDGRSLRRQSTADEYLPAHRQPGRPPRR